MPEVNLEPIIINQRLKLLQEMINKGRVPSDVGINSSGTMYPNPQAVPSPRNSMFSPRVAEAAPIQAPTVQPLVEPQAQIPQSIPAGVQPKAGGNFFRDVILPMLPSLLAVGVGTTVPGALAGAAGFSQGYAGGMEKAKDRQSEALKQYVKDNQLEDVYEVKDGQLKSIGKIKSKDRVIQPKEDIYGQLMAADASSAEQTGKNVQKKWVKPTNIPQSIWDSTTEQQKQEYFESINGR